MFRVWPQRRPPRRTLNSEQIFTRFHPKKKKSVTLYPFSQSVSRYSPVGEHVQQIQTAREGRPTGGGGLQSGPEVPHQAWDAKPQYHRKWKRRSRKVRIQRRCSDSSKLVR